ncbi:MAG: lipid A export permease/ATP-binding protein MsbA [Burkholderiaceae bacterium]|nr:lipid A export permease/ATP-binding protein MsbA [Burkholderiaceae bacterium]
MADASQSIFTDPNLRRMIALVRAHPRPLAAALAAMVIAALTDPAIAALTRVLLDRGFYERQAMAGLWVPLAFVGVFLVRGLATYASSYKISGVSQAVLVELRRRMFERLLQWPQATIENTPSGMVISKFINEASNALNLAAEVLTTAVRDSLSVVALLGVLLYYNWPLTLLTLLFAPLVGGILRVFSARLRYLNVQNQQMLGELTRAVQEAHEGSRVIKVYDGVGYESERFERINERLRRFAMKMQVAWSAATPATQLIAAVGLSIVIGLALWQARSGGLSAGEFIMFLTSALLLLQPLRHLSSLNGPIARMSAAADSVFAMIDSAGEADDGTREIERASGAIEFRGVTFHYPGAQAAALERVDLLVHPGETIALVGPSGAGKTTLINLVPHFIQPTSGQILIDSIEIGQLRLASLRRQIALVSQDVVLFDDTIGANIAYGACRGASIAQVRAAAEAAFLLPLIESLPAGFDTRIGENAVKLSGGQRQRLSIARALLKDAPLLLLDEATSALDSESERYIQLSLERLMRGRTTFVVAHRLSTIERADRIVVLEAGRVAEIGRHAELLANGGLYASLYRIQFAQSEAATAA